jgi:DNA-directed RNA polymerase specialized sigma24 family protein
VSLEASPFDHAVASETEGQLSSALASLTPEDREVLLLVADGMSQDQLARVLGIGHEAARQRVARARGRLSAVLLAPTRPGQTSHHVAPALVRSHPEERHHARN